MTTTGKFSFQPSVGNHFCQTYAQNTLAHAENVGIVMLAAHFSGENITAQSSANALAFIKDFYYICNIKSEKRKILLP